MALIAIVQSDAMAQRRQPPRLRPSGAAQRDLRSTGLLKVGDAAPDFSLNYKGSDETFTLGSFKSDKPVALVFGSYT
jgi:hypothetical protein